MPTITIPKQEYNNLLDAKLRYEYLRQVLEEDFFAPPPTRSRKEIMTKFKAAGKYGKAFLGSVEAGLRRSSYFK